MKTNLVSYKKWTISARLKRLTMPFVDIIYHALLFIGRQPFKEKENYIVICGIFKDEAPYLREWIEYHLLIGVEKIYLYNNLSSDNYAEILAPYIKSQKVEFVDWPVESGQMPAYEDCYAKVKNSANWICFLDIDEFICPYNDISIGQWLKKHESKPSILVYWKMFGTSGKILRKEAELLTESLCVSWPDLYDHGKIFLNTRYDASTLFMHVMTSKVFVFGRKFGIPSINQFGKFVYFDINRTALINSSPDIQINHYWSKSLSEYVIKKAGRGGNVYDGKEIYDMEYFLRHENINTSVDYKIFRFIIQLKMKMGIEK